MSLPAASEYFDVELSVSNGRVKLKYGEKYVLPEVWGRCPECGILL